MKKRVLLFSAFSLLLLSDVSTVEAQTSSRKFEIGVQTGLSDYHGDLSHRWFDISHAYRGNVGLTFIYNINPWINIGLMGNYGKFGHHIPITNSNSQVGMSSNMLHGNFQARLKFNNDVWMDENSKWQPYIYLGTGLSNYSKDKTNNGMPMVVTGMDWTGNLGIGITYMLTDLIGLNYNFNYAYTNHDKRDGLSIGKNDQFIQHTLGVVFQFGKKKNFMDADKDGVEDSKDKCSNTPMNVVVDNTGCPKDSDKDGVADFMDICPNEVGTSANKGCPEIKSEVRDVMKQALEGVQFETGKDVILQSSYPKLDAVAQVMKSNGAYMLDINGHTDNTGDANANLTLSKARAEAVKNYLISKGVEAGRMKSNGFGQSQPKATNDTPEGRTQNRRVEFELHY